MAAVEGKTAGLMQAALAALRLTMSSTSLLAPKLLKMQSWEGCLPCLCLKATKRSQTRLPIVCISPIEQGFPESASTPEKVQVGVRMHASAHAYPHAHPPPYALTLTSTLVGFEKHVTCSCIHIDLYTSL